MPLVQTLDAAFAAVSDQQARPFQLHLLVRQIEALRTAQRLEPIDGAKLASCACREGNIFAVPHEPILFAQPVHRFPALHLPIGTSAEAP